MNRRLSEVVFTCIVLSKRCCAFAFLLMACLFLVAAHPLKADPLIIKRDSATGRVIHVEPVAVSKAPVDNTGQLSARSQDAADTDLSFNTAKAFLSEHGKVFGLRRASRQLRPVKAETDNIGMTHVTYQQRRGNTNVFGGEVIVHIGKDGEVKTSNGQVAYWIRAKNSVRIDKKEALAAAKRRWNRRFSANISATVKGIDREIIAKGLLNNTKKRANFLAWKVRLVNVDAWIDQTYYVDAKTGKVKLELDNVKRLNRYVYDCSSRPGTDICSSNRELRYDNEWLGWTPPPEYYTFGCREGLCPRWIENPRYPSENSLDTDLLYEMFSDLHDFYWNKFQRNGANGSGGNTDGSGSESLSTDAGVTYLNYIAGNDPDCIGGVFWSNEGIGFCKGSVYPDTVGHEYTHGVKPSLVYSGQSGALDESFSDVFGQMFELFVTEATDWTTGSAPIYGNRRRSLSNPPAYSYPSDNPTTPYPDNFYSENFYCGGLDNGGVHWNSTVPSKAAYLIAEGGEFNGCAISGLGTEKLEQILYRAVVYYYANSVSFNGAYYNIISACNDLYSADDCAQVTAALQSVEMNQAGRCADPSQTMRQVPVCAQGIDQCPDDPNKTEPGQCGCGVADTDSDDDGIADCNDGCPSDPEKITAGACGCGVADTDSDGDGTPDCNDQCPGDSNKTQPGQCGCGVADTDGDGDGVANCNDGCPSDPGKTVPGVCGCGVADTDTDSDGTPDCNDGCPNDSNKVAPGACGCGVSDVDTDGDGTPDCNDGCPADSNKTAPGVCGCGVSDIDSDGDGIPNCNDGCPDDVNKTVPGVCGCGVADVDNNGNGIIDCLEQTISLQGTQYNDSIVITVGATDVTVKIGAETSVHDLATVVAINVDALGGKDTITINGGPGDESVDLSTSSFKLAGSTFEINVINGEHSVVNAGSGTSTSASITGLEEEQGFGRLYGYDNRVVYSLNSGEAFNWQLNDFDYVEVSAPGGLRDYAFLYGSPGNDTLERDENGAFFDRAEGYGDVRVSGFRRVMVYSSEGGEDAAAISGSTTQLNRFYGYTDYCLLTDTRSEAYTYLRGFTKVVASAATEGNQHYAYFYDGPGNDRFVAGPEMAVMEREDPWSEVSAIGFTRVYAYATSGGDDSAMLFGSEEGNSFRAYPASSYATLYDSQSFYSYVRGFKTVEAFGAGNNDIAYLYDSDGDDLFYGKDNYGYLADKAGVLFRNQVTDFTRVTVYSRDQGTDDDVIIDGPINYSLYKSGTW